MYVGFNTDYPGHRLDNINRLPYQPRMAISADGGSTFAAPFNPADSAFSQASFRAEALAGTTTTVGNSPPRTAPAGSKAAQPDQVGNFGGWGMSMAIDAKGTIYVQWTSTTSNIASPPAAHYLSKSTDKGRTWTHSRITPLSYGIYQFVAGGLGWTPDGGPDGTLHAVYDANPSPKVASYNNVFYLQSKDGGKTWSTPRSFAGPDASKTLNNQSYGNLSVAPNGRLDVAWWDQRDDPGIRGFDVYYSSSSDNGATWSNAMRVTTQSVSRKYGIWGNGYDMTSPPAMASTNDFALLAWDDTSLTDPALVDSTNLGGGLQDVFTAAVQYHPVPTKGSDNNNGLRVALAAIAGLEAVGLILIVVTFVGRTPRRRPAG